MFGALTFNYFRIFFRALCVCFGPSCTSTNGEKNVAAAAAAAAYVKQHLKKRKDGHSKRERKEVGEEAKRGLIPFFNFGEEENE